MMEEEWLVEEEEEEVGGEEMAFVVGSPGKEGYLSGGMGISGAICGQGGGAARRPVVWKGVVKVKQPHERTFFESSVLTKEERKWEMYQMGRRTMVPRYADQKARSAVSVDVDGKKVMDGKGTQEHAPGVLGDIADGCSLCRGMGSMPCFDCAGVGAHPLVHIEGRAAGGHICKMCQGSRMVACPICRAADYRGARMHANERMSSSSKICSEAHQVARLLSISDNLGSLHKTRD